ncbi:hypothetical protein BYT27DRAFT_7197146 [Phlegmacium glaucopus]|nr:hypothetical protein BYT27DRAFT_7197146 [Phlegmacium glaucopus]
MGRVTFMPLNRLKPKILPASNSLLIHWMLSFSLKSYVLIANTRKPSSKSSARRACVETSPLLLLEDIMMSVDLGLRLSNTWRMKYETENTKSQEAKTSTTKLEQEIKQVSGRMAVLVGQ